jgi:quinohemoprotein ethanol dehydrogenase
MKAMKRVYFVLALLILAAATSSWAVNPPKAKAAKAVKTTAAVKPAALQTTAAVPVTLDWPTYGNQFDNARFQNVDQINTHNAKNLTVAWVFHTGVLDQFATLQLSPIVINGVMYAIDGHDNVFAINAANGAQAWAFRPTDMPPIESLPLCCGRNNRGVAVGGGRVYFGRLDNVVMALNQATGAVLWRKTLAATDKYSITDGAQFVTTAQHPNGLVVIAIQGGEYEARGQVFALDATNGNIVWQFFTAQGPDTWGGNAFLTGGGMVWNPVTVDPSLGLLYFATGNAAPDVLGQNRPGNNLFTASVVALNIDTGNLAWFFQETHHDIWDYDSTSTAVLFNVTKGGVTTPAIGHCSKNGGYYILDRRNGTPLFTVTETAVPTAPGYQNASPTQPISTGVETLTPLTFVRPNTSGIPSAPQWTPPSQQEVLIQPGSQGSCEWPPAAFSPRTNLVYYGARYQPTSYLTKPNNTDTVPGGPGSTPPQIVGSSFGRSPAGINAFGIFGGTNVNTGKVAWKNTTVQPATSGLLVAGDILFYGEDNGVFHGVNAATGASLFTFNGPQQVPNAGGANGGPVAYVVNSTEYIVMPFGGNALERQNFPPDPVGDAIVAFKLP